jgi:hypothetical protein
VRPVASAVAQDAVKHAVERLRLSGAPSITPPELFAAANDAAWDAGLMLSQADVWEAVYEWGGFDYDDPPPDDTTMSLGEGYTSA